MNKQKCQYCGTGTDEEYCPKCGGLVEDKKETTPKRSYIPKDKNAPVVCEKCGRELVKEKKIDHYDPHNGDTIYKVKYVCPTKNFLGFSHKIYAGVYWGDDDWTDFMENQDGKPFYW